MSTPDTDQLMNDARCIDKCIPDGEKMSVLISVLYQLQQQGGSSGGGVSPLNGSGSPVGVVTPAAVGQTYVDTSGTYNVWTSFGLTNASWVQGNEVSGIIKKWKGTISTIPAGYQLCDGTNGTPDLRDKFVVGAKQDNLGLAKTNLTGALTKAGGSISHSHLITDLGHTHSLTLSSGGVLQSGTDLPYLVSTFTDTNPSNVTVNNTSAPQPYYALAYIMKL